MNKPPFHKVLDGELPGVILTQTQHTFVMLTHAAITQEKSELIMPGHTLFVSKRIGVENRDDMKEDECIDLARMQKLFSEILRDVFDKKKAEEFISGHQVEQFHTHMVATDRGETDWSMLPSIPNYPLEERLDDGDRIQDALRKYNQSRLDLIIPSDNRTRPVNQSN